ncbi:MAG: glycosyltransferase, partial [Thermoplasmata archaeon]|nr:glycosyltransferase [Thermoplasmata archaeon]
MKVVVLIPTLNCAADLGDCFRALNAQTFRDFEVLIVDGRSKDGTDRVAIENGARVVYDEGKTRGHAANTGLAATDADIIVFTDADTLPRPDWLENLVQHFSDPVVASVGGPNIAPKTDNYLGKAADVTYGSKVMTGDTRYGKIPMKITPIYHNPGCNAAYRREVIEDAGGFDEDLPTAEDLALDHRITERGHRIFFDPGAIVYHKRRPTLKGFARQIYRYGWGRAMANARYPALRRKLHIAPTLGLFALAILFSLAAMGYFLPAPFGLYPFLVLLAAVAIYFTVSLAGASQSHSPYTKGRYVLGAPFLIGV